ncbi:MAG: SCO family protein [Burkholderiaceae bacterium]|nr:SCO family protein [Burkholderiaceae bacterium]
MALFAALLALCAPAAGRYKDPADSRIDPPIVKIDESTYLGQALDAGTQFLDERGRPFTLADLLGKPVILVFSYFGCDGTCPAINQNLAGALERIGRFRPGLDYRVLTVSFDRQDDVEDAGRFARATLTGKTAASGGWRFAVLRDPAADSPQKLARSVGFRFFWSRVDKTFLHPNVLVFLTPEGRVARYLYGTGMQPRDLELALIEADWGRISASASAIFDLITGACFSYNYSEGRYQPNYALFAGLGSLAFGVGLIAVGLIAYRRQHARRTPDAI